MKYLFILIILLLNVSAFSQDSDQAVSFIKEGIELHDKGNFSAAAKKYQKALEADKNNLDAMFELTITYTAMEEYVKAIEYCDMLLSEGVSGGGQVYVNKATAYDLMGDSDKAIEVYKEGIEKHPYTYLLHFNLAITFFQSKHIEEAVQSFQNALRLNPEHTSSNVQLANANFYLENNVRALLGFYYFLLLEPKGDRAEKVHQIIDVILQTGVEKKGNSTINININASLKDTTDIFNSARFMLPMLAASIMTKKDESESEVFCSTTKTVVSVASRAKEKDENDFYVRMYIHFFDALKENGFEETFCHWIAQSKYREASVWLKNNEDKVSSFVNWFLEYTETNERKTDETIQMDPRKKGKPKKIEIAPSISE